MESNIHVRRGTLPEYVRIEDTRSNGVEMAEIASVLYAGATLSDKESLYMPERGPIPTNGVLFPNEEIPEEPKHEQPSKPKRNFFTQMGKKMANLFSGSEEDDTELLDE